MNAAIEVRALRKRFGPVLALDGMSFAGPQALTVSGLPAERVVAVLSGSGVAFSEVAAYRASLEEACLELTGGAAEYRAAAAGEVAR